MSGAPMQCNARSCDVMERTEPNRNRTGTEPEPNRKTARACKPRRAGRRMPTRGADEMTAIVRIDDEVVDVAEFIRLLKLTGKFESLIEQLVRDKLTVHAAKK